MRISKENGLVALTSFALGAAVMFLVQLSRKTRNRKVEHDIAVAKLRDSGEYFFADMPSARASDLPSEKTSAQ